MSALIMANARRNVDSSAGPRTAPSTSAPASAAHWPIAANDPGPAMTAAIPTASSPASGEVKGDKTADQDQKREAHL
jgi:hypothetical protein